MNKNELNNNEYLMTSQVSERLERTLNDVNFSIRSNLFLNAVKIGNRWSIPISDFNEYRKALKDTTYCLTT